MHGILCVTRIFAAFVITQFGDTYVVIGPKGRAALCFTHSSSSSLMSAFQISLNCLKVLTVDIPRFAAQQLIRVVNCLQGRRLQH